MTNSPSSSPRYNWLSVKAGFADTPPRKLYGGACIYSATMREDGESGEPVGMRAARIRSNIADVYGVICGEFGIKFSHFG